MVSASASSFNPVWQTALISLVQTKLCLLITKIMMLCGGVLQIQYSLLDRRPDNGMAAFAQAHNMALLPYGVVAGGFLSDKYIGVSARDVDVNTYSKGKYASVLGQIGGWAWLQQLLQVRGILRLQRCNAGVARGAGSGRRFSCGCSSCCR